MSPFEEKLQQYKEIVLAPDNVFDFKYKNGGVIKTLYEQVKSSIKLTEFIPFSCDFDARGLCVNHRTNSINNKMCCCMDCYQSVGYLRRGLPILKEDFKTYNELFLKGTGFWRKDGGCSLPRELRSPICVYYLCWHENDGRQKLHDVLYKMREASTNTVGLIKSLMQGEI